MAAPQKTLANLRSAVRDNLDESSVAFWTEAQLTRFINRAKDRVWTEARALKEDYFLVTRTSTDGSLTILGETYAATGFQIVAGTRDYTLPPDFAEMKLIEVTTSGYETTVFVYRDLTQPDMRRMLTLTDNQSPATFFFDLIGERTMRIAPKSDTTLDLRITYVRILADLSAETDALEMPHPLYKAVEEYATANALKMDRNPNAAAWEASGRSTVLTMVGSHARQVQDVEWAQGYLGDYTGWG